MIHEEKIETLASGATTEVPEFVNVQEAARIMGVSRATFWRVRGGAVKLYQSEQYRRVRLVKRADLAALVKPVAVLVAKAQGELQHD